MQAHSLPLRLMHERGSRRYIYAFLSDNNRLRESARTVMLDATAPTPAEEEREIAVLRERVREGERERVAERERDCG